MSTIESAFLDSISADTILKDRWLALIALASPIDSSPETQISTPAAPTAFPHAGVASPRRTKIGTRALNSF